MGGDAGVMGGERPWVRHSCDIVPPYGAGREVGGRVLARAIRKVSSLSGGDAGGVAQRGLSSPFVIVTSKTGDDQQVLTT